MFINLVVGILLTTMSITTIIVTKDIQIEDIIFLILGMAHLFLYDRDWGLKEK